MLKPLLPMISIYITSIFVDDQAKAERFYTETLGFVKVLDIPIGADRFLTVASAQDPSGTQLLLEPNQSPIARTYQEACFQAGLHVMVFRVDDIAAEYQRLTALGVRFRQPPTPLGPVTVAVLEDSCGNLVQLAQG